MATYTQQLEDFIQDVLISIHANIRDLKEKRTFADPEEYDYIDGRLFSYGEMLAILRASAVDTGIEPKQLGL
ncbi:hypothetical protein GO730_03265 [Spirosoma sp. HMF3257]|uniref:Uncharacterized protein n=1 Tax=Spirosoma telluris TaxID=2183553 RepID=A0A327NWB7_9BACT|nr:hypothetical protein [Spirosoma telluris]RAI78326.1 hypothetical protein HMF3257_03190 [Spirosoma telluris]